MASLSEITDLRKLKVEKPSVSASPPQEPSSTELGLESPSYIYSCFIRVHSWFKAPCIPFAIIRVNPCSSVAKEPRPSVASNLLLNLHQQISGWKARATFIRVHSCSFVVQSPPASVSIRGSKPPLHSWFTPPRIRGLPDQSNFPATLCHRIPPRHAATPHTWHRFSRITRTQRIRTTGFPDSRESAESAAMLPNLHIPATCTLNFRQLSATSRPATTYTHRDSRRTRPASSSPPPDHSASLTALPSLGTARAPFLMTLARIRNPVPCRRLARHC